MSKRSVLKLEISEIIFYKTTDLQISPTSRDWGLRMGYGKEIYDYHKKKGNMPMQTIIADSQKDLKNNLYGSNMGYNNPNQSCENMLDEFRTENMRKENIR